MKASQAPAFLKRPVVSGPPCRPPGSALKPVQSGLPATPAPRRSSFDKKF
jgi:hypothetical protein